MTDSEMDRLWSLQQEDFPRDEWLVLSFAREWVYGGRVEPVVPWLEDYRTAYPPVDRACHMKLIRVMDLANRLRLFIGGKRLGPGASCSLADHRQSTEPERE